MKFALVLAMICISVIAVPHKLSNNQIKRIEDLKTSHSWGGIMLNLAELHMLAQGPLDELISAIEGVVADLNKKLEKAHANFDERTGAHQAEVNRLQGEIDNAKSDIANTETYLNDVLYVQKAQLEEDIENLGQNIENTHKYLEELAENRAKEQKEYETKVEEANGAIAAINECLELLSTLDGAASLAQVKKAKASLQKVEKKLGKGVEASFVKALVALSTSEFADSEAIQRVMDMMMKVRENLETAIENWGAENEAAIAAYNEEVQNKLDEINRMTLEIQEKTEQLDTCNNQIAEAEAFLAVRRKDLAEFQADLDAENEQYEKDTQIYNDLVAQFNKELEACAEALEILNSAEFAGYLSDRMSMDTVIDQPHDTGVQV